MKIYKYPDQEQWSILTKRPVRETEDLQAIVKKILKRVKAKGDKAIIKYTNDFDGVKLKDLAVSSLEMNEAEGLIEPVLKNAILQARENISIFHTAQKETTQKIDIMPGITCWRQSVPISKVGLYIPGGSAPLFSTVLMLGVPAQLAGCHEIVLCTPPDINGSIHPAILFAAKICGITKIYKVGGVQAIAAMTYGTKTIPAVYKIFGPGNQFVTQAKQLVQLDGLSIDMPAGPSEVLVIADETAVPSFVAADLLSQAEHGPDSQVVLVTTNETLAEKVKEEIKIHLKGLPRKKIAKEALKNSNIIITKNINEAVEFSNQYAPEHLILACKDAEEIATSITAAGSVFIGNYSPESAGDYASGTNHTLPTNGYAAMYSGVSLDSFYKKITYQQLSKEGLTSISNTVMTMAAAEGLDGHKNAIAIRLKK